MTTDPELPTRLATLLSDILFAEVDPARLDSRLIEDYGANSMDVVDIAERIERKFQIKVPNEQIAKMVTFGDVVAFVDLQLPKQV